MVRKTYRRNRPFTETTISPKMAKLATIAESKKEPIKGDRGDAASAGSVERSRGLTNRNRIVGGGEWDELP